MVVVLAGILSLVLATSFPHPSVPMPPPTPIRSAAAPAKNGTESLQTWGGSEPLASAAHALVRAVLSDAKEWGAVSNMSHSAAKELPLLLVSIYSPFNDRFVCVDAKGEARAEAEYPWSPTCCSCAARRTAALLAGSARGDGGVVGGGRGGCNPGAYTPGWAAQVMLRAENGKLLAFRHRWRRKARPCEPMSIRLQHTRHTGDGRRHPPEPGQRRFERSPWRATARPQQGPPWRVADRKDDASVQIGLRVVLADLSPRPWRVRALPVLSVDHHIATAQDVGARCASSASNLLIGRSRGRVPAAARARRRPSCPSLRRMCVTRPESAFHPPRGLRRCARRPCLRAPTRSVRASGAVRGVAPFNKSLLVL